MPASAFAVVALIFGTAHAQAPACDLLRLDNGFVCRCNATYCDEIEQAPPLADNFAIVYTTNEGGQRLRLGILPAFFEDDDTANADTAKATIDISFDGTTHQEVLGFGGAFTDATAGVLSALNADAQRRFVSAYFSRKGGARYSMGRVPLGGSDFSTEPYSYSNTPGDFNVSDFVLRDDRGIEGEDYKLELLLKAQQEIQDSTDPNDEALNKLQVCCVYPYSAYCVVTISRRPFEYVG